MTRPAQASAIDRLTYWSRVILATIALFFFAGITTKIIVTGSVPFGSSSHWSVDERLGVVLQVLAYSMWILAALGRVERRFFIGAIVLAISFPLEGQTLTIFTALASISLSLWIGLRTLDTLRDTTHSLGSLGSGTPLHAR